MVGGRPPGVGLPPLRGASGVRRCPSPDRQSFRACCRGSATRVSRMRFVWAWGPSTSPTACALASRRCVLWGWRRSLQGGAAFRLCQGRLGSGASPLPAASPLGGLSGSAAHLLWARVCGCGGPVLSPWLACSAESCVPRGWSGAVPGGDGLRPLPGASGVRRCPSLGRPSFGAGCRGSVARVSRVRLVWAWGPSTSRTAYALASRRCALWGWRKGVPWGGVFRRSKGRLRSGAPPLPAARPLGGLSGSATDVLWARMCGCGGPALSP